MIGDKTKVFIELGEALGLPDFHLYAVAFLMERIGSFQENVPGGEGVDLNRPMPPESTANRKTKGSTSKNEKKLKLTELLPWFLLHVSLQSENSQVRTEIEQIKRDFPAWYLPALESRKTILGEPRWLKAFPTAATELPSEIVRAMDSILDMGISSGIIGVLESEGTTASSLPVPRPPLVLTHDRKHIYITRHRREEDRLLHLLEERIRPRPARFREVLKQFTLDKPVSRSAIKLLNQFAEGYGLMILSGGPGTGKTSTVAQFICLITRNCQKLRIPIPEIALCAPTGRAARRMAESLGELQPRPRNSTIHSLIGISQWKRPHHNPSNPLSAQLVIADEASMIDLGLMNSLLSALSPTAALLLVGDPNQLPPVGMGAILGDMLSGNDSPESPVRKGLTILTKVYRSDSSIVRVARTIAEGQFPELLSAMAENSGNVELRPLGEPAETAMEIARMYLNAGNMKPKSATETESASMQIKRIIALSPLRIGPWGNVAMNKQITMALGRNSSRGFDTFFPGMPIIVTANNRKMNLYNGETAILQEEQGKLQALFADNRKIPLHTIGNREAAWIQTIHKSQGSEYNTVIIILPPEAQRLLSREILYTAFTRAKKRIILFSDPETIKTALANRIQRNSRIRNWAAG